MTDLTIDDGPELVPPAELLELRSQLSVAPSDEVRRTHLEAIVAQVCHGRRTAWGRVASGTARGAAAVVVTLTITSGLAAAQVLPAPAQKIFSSVSDRFTGRVDEADVPAPATTDPAPAADDDEATTTTTREPAPEPVVATTTTSTTLVPPAPVVTTPPEPTTTTTTPPTPTTLPGPPGPGSEQEPEVPVTEPEPEPEPTEPTEPTVPTDPNEPTEPAKPQQPVANRTVKAVDGGVAVEEGDPG